MSTLYQNKTIIINNIPKFLVCSQFITIVMFVLMTPTIIAIYKQDVIEKEASLSAFVAQRMDSSTFPFTAKESIDACVEYTGGSKSVRPRTLGSCIASEDTMRTNAEPLWRSAPAEVRAACLRSVGERPAEPAAGIYVCLKD